MSAVDKSQTPTPRSQDELDVEHQKLRKATRDWESYFIGALLKKMHATAAKGGLFEQRSEMATYREMFDEAIAAEIGKQGAFGIADALYDKLALQLDRQKNEQ